eukprot:jgi/Tetstr1/435391/TSEL_002648.t1
MGPKKGPSTKQLTIQHELEALKMHFKSCCREHGLEWKEPNQKAVLAIIEEKIEAFKSLQKLIFQGPAVTPSFAAMAFDLLAGYNKVKNVCFWGAHVGDEGLLALADLLQSCGNRWYKGSNPIHLEITCDGNSVPPAEWPGMSASLRSTGIAAGSAVQGPGAALPSLFFNDVPLVVAPDVQLPDSEDYVDVTDGAGSVHSAAGGALEAYRFQGEVGAPLACRWSESAVERLGNTLGTKGLRLRILVLDHNLLSGRVLELLCRGIARCHSLKQISLAHCGIDEASAPSLVQILRTAPEAFDKDASALRLQHVNLQGNPLGGGGLTTVSEGICLNSTLTAINLADIGVSDDNLPGLESFRNALLMHPVMFKVDFSMNHIGNTGAQLMMAALEERKNIKAFRMTSRLDRATAKAFAEMMISRNVKSKKKKVVRRRKKTAGGAPGGEEEVVVEEGSGEEGDAPGDTAAEDAAAVDALLAGAGAGAAAPEP